MMGWYGWRGEVRPWTCGFTEAALETMKTMTWPLSASSKNQGPTVLARLNRSPA